MSIWTVKNIYVAKECFYATEDDEQCQHSVVDEWTTESFDNALAIVKDFLDVPLAKLTIDQVKEDFSSAYLSEEKANSIMDYYNGRLAIWEYAEKELRTHVSAGSIDNVFCYDIPAKYSSYDSFGDQPEKEIMQLRIEVQCKNN